MKYDKFLETVVAKPREHYYFMFKIYLSGDRAPAYFEQISSEVASKEFSADDYKKVIFDFNKKNSEAND